jgi:hypothetical protein
MRKKNIQLFLLSIFSFLLGAILVYQQLLLKDSKTDFSKESAVLDKTVQLQQQWFEHNYCEMSKIPDTSYMRNYMKQMYDITNDINDMLPAYNASYPIKFNKNTLRAHHSYYKQLWNYINKKSAKDIRLKVKIMQSSNLFYTMDEIVKKHFVAFYSFVIIQYHRNIQQNGVFKVKSLHYDIADRVIRDPVFVMENGEKITNNIFKEKALTKGLNKRSGFYYFISFDSVKTIPFEFSYFVK